MSNNNRGPVSSTRKLTSKSSLSRNTKGSVTSAPTAETREKREKTAQGSTNPLSTSSAKNPAPSRVIGTVGTRSTAAAKKPPVARQIPKEIKPQKSELVTKGKEKNAPRTKTTVVVVRSTVDSPATDAPAYLTTDPRYWSANDVAQWAKEVLQWDDDEADVLVQQRLKGVRLLSYENNEDAFIRNLSSSIPIHALHQMFSQIAGLSEKSKMRQAKKRPESEDISEFILSKIGASFPFVGRKKLLDSLLDSVRKDYKLHLEVTAMRLKSKEIRSGGKTAAFNFLYGAPGIGKTRCLYELMRSITANEHNVLPAIKKWHPIFLTFKNGFAIIENDRKWPADIMLAIRMLRSELFLEKTLRDCCNEFGPMRLSISKAIQLISQAYELDNHCGILLIIDEINQCFEATLPRDYVATMLRGLANAKSPELPYVLPIFAGTSFVGFSEQVKASSFVLTEHPLGLLSIKDVISMVDKIQQQGLIPLFHNAVAFMQLLRDCGGLPRFIQFVCENVAEYHEQNPTLPMVQWDWVHILETCIISIGSAYHEIPREALVDCLLGTPVTRQNMIGNKNWGQLEMSGAIVIINNVPVVPFLGLLNFARRTQDTYLTELSIWPMLNAPPPIEKCFNWQDWEQFNVEFAVMKLKLLFKVSQGSNVPLDQFFSNAIKCGEGIRKTIWNTVVVPCTPTAIRSRHQLGDRVPLVCVENNHEHPFPQAGQSIKNGIGGAADGILVLECLINSSKKPEPLLLFYSMKWTEDTMLLKHEPPLDLNTIEDEVAKMSAQFNYLPAKKLFVICTGRTCDVDDDDLPADTIVIHKATFKSYFGPTFESRAVFTSVSPRRNPNTANPLDFFGVGTASAKKVHKALEEGQIESTEQFLALTPKKFHDVICRQLTFDDED